MAQRNGDRIGNVGWFGEFGKLKLLLHGKLHLSFGSSARSGKKFLYFRRGV